MDLARREFKYESNAIWTGQIRAKTNILWPKQYSGKSVNKIEFKRILNKYKKILEFSLGLRVQIQGSRGFL